MVVFSIFAVSTPPGSRSKCQGARAAAGISKSNCDHLGREREKIGGWQLAHPSLSNSSGGRLREGASRGFRFKRRPCAFGTLPDEIRRSVAAHCQGNSIAFIRYNEQRFRSGAKVDQTQEECEGDKRGGLDGVALRR